MKMKTFNLEQYYNITLGDCLKWNNILQFFAIRVIVSDPGDIVLYFLLLLLLLWVRSTVHLWYIMYNLASAKIC